MSSRAKVRTTIDTSVLVPALLPWHPLFERARAGAADVRVVPAHAVVECYSVLTRLPRGQRLSAVDAAEAIAAMDLEPLGLAPGEQRGVVFTLASAGIAGGAVYDGVIAETAKAHGVTLLSLDRRAAPTYEAVGVDFRLI